VEPARLGGFTVGDTANGYVLTESGWKKPGGSHAEHRARMAAIHAETDRLVAAERPKEKSADEEWYIHEGKLMTRPRTTPVESKPSNLNGFLGFMTFMGAFFVIGPLVTPAQAWVVFAVVLLASALFKRWFMVPFVLLTGIPVLLVLVALTAGLIVLPLVVAIAVLGYKGAREVKFWA
jgi:hypothetical protein